MLNADDLSPLTQLTNGAEYIGLGESVHTSGGYYQMKERVIRYLVEHGGVRALAMETPHTRAEVAADFIRTCQGDVLAALRGVFPVFADDHLRDLFLWLCQFNQRNPTEPVVFFGFDEQQPGEDSAVLSAFVNSAAAIDAQRLLDGIRSCTTNPDFGAPYSRSDFSNCISGLRDLDSYFSAHQNEMIARTSATAFDWGKIALVGFQAWQEEVFYAPTDFPKSSGARDTAMAYLLPAIRQLRASGKKTIVWAHNYHLAASFSPASPPTTPGTSTMGTYLKSQLGDRYQPIALIGYDVQSNWPGVATTTYPKFQGVETRLHCLARPFLLIDSTSSWLGTDLTYVGHPDNLFVIPKEEFRAFIYLDHTPGMRALFW